MIDKIPNWWNEAPVIIQVMATIAVIITSPIWMFPMILALFIYGTWEAINEIMG